MISKKMKYALKALIEIVNTEAEYISASAIAENTKVPIKFLEQIMTELRRGRILNSRKGSHGGYYFIKEPSEISLAEIYRLFDGPIALQPCASLTFYEKCDDCPNEEQCNIHPALIIVRKATLGALESINLYQMAKGNFDMTKENWVI
jgi:Rrf2 family protein